VSDNSHPHARGLPVPAGDYVVIVRLTSRILGGFGVGLGLVIILGGPDRFTAPSLAVARQVPGQQYTWGAVAAAAGIAILVGGIRRAWTVLLAGTVALALWCTFFAVSVALAALIDPHAPFTGVVTYGTLALIAISHSVGLAQGRR
jgi:hypothetical protein